MNNDYWWWQARVKKITNQNCPFQTQCSTSENDTQDWIKRWGIIPYSADFEQRF